MALNPVEINKTAEKLLEPFGKIIQEHSSLMYGMLEVLCERDPAFAEDFKVASEKHLTRLRESWNNHREIDALEALLTLKLDDI